MNTLAVWSATFETTGVNPIRWGVLLAWAVGMTVVVVAVAFLIAGMFGRTRRDRRRDSHNG